MGLACCKYALMLHPAPSRIPCHLLQIYLTDILFSSPHLHFSEAQKAAIIAWAKSLGADVPSLHAIKKCQSEVRKEVGEPTEKFVSPLGNVFYFNSIAHAITKVRNLG